MARSSSLKKAHEPWEAVPLFIAVFRDERAAAQVSPKIRDQNGSRFCHTSDRCRLYHALPVRIAFNENPDGSPPRVAEAIQREFTRHFNRYADESAARHLAE